ncbi:MAG: hypothetical protein FWC43_12750, partial [Planctomycetaceae bacterium]|nr:hypothetical protein [Planctomycetaceae bacterium]
MRNEILPSVVCRLLSDSDSRFPIPEKKGIFPTEKRGTSQTRKNLPGIAAKKFAMNGSRERNGVKRPDRIAGKSGHCAALRSR